MTEPAMAATAVTTISTLWAVFSVIGGSVIGGLISTLVAFLVLRKNLKAAKAQRDEDRDEKRKALGYSLFFKMRKLQNGLFHMQQDIEGCYALARQRKFDGEPWMIVGRSVPDTQPVYFTAEEMAMLLPLNSELFNEIADLEELHNSNAALFKLYGEKREKTLEGFGGDVSGGLILAGLDQKQREWLAPKTMELNQLATILRERCTEGVPLADAAFVQLRNTLDDKLGLKHKLIPRPQTA